MQTQTLPWNELQMSDEEGDEESIEFAHTETQTLLSSFFIEDSLPELTNIINKNNNNKLIKSSSSEDAGTDPMMK